MNLSTPMSQHSYTNLMCMCYEDKSDLTNDFLYIAPSSEFSTRMHVICTVCVIMLYARFSVGLSWLGYQKA